jgi:hypothetical protein
MIPRTPRGQKESADRTDPSASPRNDKIPP